MKKLNVFLDTSIIVENNFLHGGKLKVLLSHAEKGYVSLFTNEIVIREIKSQIKQRVYRARSFLKNRLQERELWIMSNTKYKAEIELLKKIDREEICKCFYEKIDNLVKSIPITIIPYENVKLDVILNNYFDNNPPFSEGEKKHEFPDAIILASIDIWCKANKKEINIVSKDEDWLKYESDYIHKYENLNSLLSDVAKITEEEKRILFVEKLFIKKQKNIITAIKAYIDDNDNIFFLDNAGDIDEYSVTNLEIISHDLLNISIDKASFYVQITFDIDADARNYQTFWDSIDKEYIELPDLEYSFKEEVSTEVQLVTKYNILEPDFIEIEIISINNEEAIILGAEVY